MVAALKDEKIRIEAIGMEKSNQKLSLAGSIKKLSLRMGRAEENKTIEAKVLPKKKGLFCCVSDSTDPAAEEPPSPPLEAKKTEQPITSSPATETLSPIALATITETEPLNTADLSASPSKFVDSNTTTNTADPSIPDVEAFGESKRNVLCTASSSMINPFALDSPTSVRNNENAFLPNEEDPSTRSVSNVRRVRQSTSTFFVNLSMLLRRKGKARVFVLSKREQERMLRDMDTYFSEALVQQMEHTETSILEATLFASRQLVWQFWALDDMIQSKTRMPETTKGVIFGGMEAFLYPRIAALYSLDDDFDLTPYDAALLVTWMDDFCRAVVEHATGVELQEPWQSDCDKLADFYLEKAVRLRVRECLDRALAYGSDDDVRQDRNGNMVTELAEQVTYLIEQQLSVAREVLPQKYQPEVFSICNQEISLFVSNVQLKIGSEWRNICTSLYCAFINDAFRLAEHCEERNGKYLDRDVDEKRREEADQAIKDLADLSLHATDFLCQRIMLDLCRPQNDILTSVGDAVWEKDESSNAVECTILTLKDFFGDLERWLISEYYFVKVLKQCFQLVIRLYLESFFGNTLVRGVENAQTVSKELDKDYARLANYFNEDFFDKYRNKDNDNNFYSQEYVNNELLILKHMAAIVLPQNGPDSCRGDILAILKRCPSEEGSAAILHLAGLRKQNIREAESASWVKEIAAAKKLIVQCKASVESKEAAEQLTKNDEAAVLHIPDLRNSNFIQNISPVRLSVMNRDISVGTMDYAQSTMRLLDTVHRDPAIIKHAKEGAAAISKGIGDPAIIKQAKEGAAAITRGIGAGLRFAIQYFPPLDDNVFAALEEYTKPLKKEEQKLIAAEEEDKKSSEKEEQKPIAVVEENLKSSKEVIAVEEENLKSSKEEEQNVTAAVEESAEEEIQMLITVVEENQNSSMEVELKLTAVVEENLQSYKEELIAVVEENQKTSKEEDPKLVTTVEENQKSAKEEDQKLIVAVEENQKSVEEEDQKLIVAVEENQKSVEEVDPKLIVAVEENQKSAKEEDPKLVNS